MTALVIVEHDNRRIAGPTFNAVTAARTLGRPVTLLVAGSDCCEIARMAGEIAGADAVIHADGPALASLSVETVADLLFEIGRGYTHILAAATAFGSDLVPMAAARLDVQPISNVIEIASPDTFLRLMHAGTVRARIVSRDPTIPFTVRASAFPAAESRGGKAPVHRIQEIGQPNAKTFLDRSGGTPKRDSLDAARIVVSGGHGLGSKENFAMLERIADRLGGAVGASRAAVEAGFASTAQQVGQTGKVVAPDIYIAVGISGAIQHLAGMKDSKTIIVINDDEEAPIFHVADLAVVGDLFEVLPELERCLNLRLARRSRRILKDARDCSIT